MNRIDMKFRELKKQGRRAFIVYITAGDPDLDITEDMVLALESSGADIIELGIPFSDPLADGPTIQAASHRALKKRVTLEKIFGTVRRLREITEIPIVFMTYYNPIMRYGLKPFFKSCAAYGVDGVIVPDLPYEESAELRRLGKKQKIAVIFLAAPTSTVSRLKEIVRASSGFIYYVSLTGVTGIRSKLPGEVISNVRLIKKMTDKPVAVGFGISNPVQARQMAKTADGVIVGSAIVRMFGARRRLISRVSGLAGKLARAIHGV